MYQQPYTAMTPKAVVDFFVIKYKNKLYFLMNLDLS